MENISDYLLKIKSAIKSTGCPITISTSPVESKVTILQSEFPACRQAGAIDILLHQKHALSLSNE